MRLDIDIPVDTILVGLGAALILAALLRRNSNFFDLRGILSSHCKLFAQAPLAWAAVFAAPLPLSAAALHRQLLTKGVADTLNVVLSILLAMFFAMLGVLVALPPKSPGKSVDAAARRRAEAYNALLKETFNAVLFECVLGVTLLALCVGASFGGFAASWELAAVSGLVYYLALVLAINIFVILKRVKALFDHRFDGAA